MKKRIISWVLLFLFILSAFPPVQVHAEKGEAFTGTRTVTFTADWSDLANYIDGDTCNNTSKEKDSFFTPYCCF